MATKGTLTLLLAMALAGASLFGCGGGGGGGDADEDAVDSDEGTSGGEEEGHEPMPEGASIEGLMGTISQDAVIMGVESRNNRYDDCFAARWEHMDILSGRMVMSFRIRVDGSVLWVFPSESSIGDRETERCILDAARGIRFRRPRGGEAEFTYTMQFALPDQVRPPLNWDGTRISDVLAQNVGGVLESCRPAGSHARYVVSAYVGPGGEVMTVGASTGDHEAAEGLDCVSQAVGAWPMPDPGSYPAKVIFSVE